MKFLVYHVCKIFTQIIKIDFSGKLTISKNSNFDFSVYILQTTYTGKNIWFFKYINYGKNHIFDFWVYVVGKICTGKMKFDASKIVNILKKSNIIFLGNILQT